MKKILRVLGVIALNIVLIALLLEVLLRVAVPFLPDSLQIAANWVINDTPYSEDWTPAWQESREHFYALRPNIDNELQFGSPRVRFALSTTELWEGAGIGFRTDPVDFRVDAVVVGDSFGFCYTERVDCWVDQLAAQANLGIVNLSMPVTGTVSHRRILETFGTPYEPPLVIWQFFGNDFNDDYGLAVFRDDIEPVEDGDLAPPLERTAWDAIRERSVLVAITETLITGRFVGFAETEAVFNKPYQVNYGEHQLIFGSLYEQVAMDMTRDANQIGYEMSRDAFTEAQDLVDTWGGQIVVVIMPTREEVYAHLTADYLGTEAMQQLSSAREAMQTLCGDLSLICYDPYEVFVERALQDEALYHSDDMHLNAHGNAVLAQALQVWLAEDDILPLDLQES